MKARLATVAIVVTLTTPVTGLAQDNPWAMIKGLLREPVSELKQQLEQIRPPGRVPRSTPPPKAAVEPDGTVPRPVARPSRTPTAGAEPATSVDVDGAAPPTAATPTTPSAVARPSPDVAVMPRPEVGTAATENGGTASPDMAGSVAATAPQPPATAPLAVAVPATDTPARMTAGTDTTARDDGALTDNVAVSPADADPPPLARAPIPRPRPQAVIAYVPNEATAPSTGSSAAIGALVRPLPPLDNPPPAARSTCGVALARLGVEAKPIAPIREGACGIGKPVAIAALGDGVTDLTTRAIVRCQLAETLANWLGDDVQPAARRFLDGDVVGLRVAASYTCRSRNNVRGAKLSEHGRGNAIDISAFRVAGRGWIAVGGRHSVAESRFLSAIRKAACGPFTTVLGPGSDAHHSDHFHLDLAKRSKRGRSRGLYCR